MTALRTPLCGVFNNRVLRSLALSDVFAFLGVWLTSLTLLTGVYEITHSSFAQGLVIAAQFGPALLVVPIAGHILDRFNPVIFLIGCRSICAAIAIVLFAAGSQMPVAVVLILFVTFSSVFSLSVMATGVLMPLAVSAPDLARANILLRVIPNLMMVASGLFLMIEGPALGVYGELLLAGIAFGLAVFALVPLCFLAPSKQHGVQSNQRISGSFLQGLVYLSKTPELGLRFLLRMGVFVCTGAVILLAVIAETEFSHIANAVGLFFAARGSGMVLGSVAAMPFLKRPEQFEAFVLFAGLCLFAGGIVLASWTVSAGLLLTALALGIAFAGEGIAKPVSLTVLQKRVAPEYLGRVMALEQGLSGVVQTLLTLVIAACLVAPTDTRIVMTAIGLCAGALLVALLALAVMRRDPGVATHPQDPEAADA